jgi:hypothetical protein
LAAGLAKLYLLQTKEPAMRISVLTALVISGLVSATPSVAEDKVETGTIKSYECGDNCYLTITTAKGEELTALCVADECVPWNEQPRCLKT